MKLDPVSVVLLVAAAAMIVVAIRTGSDTGISGPVAGAVAGLCATAVVVRGVRSRMPASGFRLGESEPSSPYPIAGDLGSSRFGRQQVYETILMLEAHRAGHPLLPPVDEEDRLARSPPAEFRQWAERRLDDLERGT